MYVYICLLLLLLFLRRLLVDFIQWAILSRDYKGSRRVRSGYIAPSPRVILGWPYFLYKVIFSASQSSSHSCYSSCYKASGYCTIPVVYLCLCPLLSKHSSNYPMHAPSFFYFYFFPVWTLMHTETISLTGNLEFCVSLVNIFSFTIWWSDYCCLESCWFITQII